MGKVLGTVVSMILSVVAAQLMTGSFQKTKTMTLQAVDSISRQILKQAAWVLSGVAFLTSGTVLLILEVTELGAESPIPSLIGKALLIVLGAVSLYMGLSAPSPNWRESAAQPTAGEIDWAGLVHTLVQKMTEKEPSPPEKAQTNDPRFGLSDQDIDRIVASLRRTPNSGDADRGSRDFSQS